MAKIFWIAEKEDDTMEIFAFNNKRKAEEKAMELAPHFSFGDHGVPKKEGNDYGDDWLYSGMTNAKECFLLYRKDAMPHARGFDSEDEAREEYPGDAAGACFPVKLKGGMGSVYMSMEAEANGELWTFEDGDIYENKQTKTTMKYVPTFESFLSSHKLNEDTDWAACSGAQKDKFAPVLKALKCEYRDLVFFELLHNELDYYTEEEYDAAFEKGQALEKNFTSKSFALKKINPNGEDEDPHGNMTGSIISIKGTKLKYAEFGSDMNYYGTICSAKDIKALEAFFLDGKKASTKHGVEYPTEMRDVYGEYCEDMGF